VPCRSSHDDFSRGWAPGWRGRQELLRKDYLLRMSGALRGSPTCGLFPQTHLLLRRGSGSSDLPAFTSPSPRAGPRV
jgi:hypothetical protein